MSWRKATSPASLLEALINTLTCRAPPRLLPQVTAGGTPPLAAAERWARKSAANLGLLLVCACTTAAPHIKEAAASAGKVNCVKKERLVVMGVPFC